MSEYTQAELIDLFFQAKAKLDALPVPRGFRWFNIGGQLYRYIVPGSHFKGQRRRVAC